VDADSQKHKSDPTKRSPEKASRSVMGFSKAFNKLDARTQKEGVAEDVNKQAQDDEYKRKVTKYLKKKYQKEDVELVEELINELSKATLASYETGARAHADKLVKQADRAKKQETKYPKYKKATMRYAGAHKAQGKIIGKNLMGEDGGMGAGAVAAGPTNTSSGGAVASVGQPPGSKFGEPGVDLRKKKKNDPRMFKQFRRKPPKA
jgi:chemotaxis protein histidine kinase CheA